MSYTGKAIDLSKYDKYSKQVELTKVEVELSIVDDISKILKRLQSVNSALSKSAQSSVNLLGDFASVQGKLQTASNKAEDDMTDARQDFKEATSIIDKASKMAKELGLNPQDIKGTTEVVKLVENIEDTISVYERNKSDITKILSI
jgi:predicted transcriptional regulator